jgi:CRISPR-associated protein Cas5 subtype I-A
MQFSVKYVPTALFSLKDSNSTNSGAKALFLPSPYAIKMAILNQAITAGGELEKLEQKKSKEFMYVRDAEVNYHIANESYFCINNSFVKILKQKEDKRTKKAKEEGAIFEPGFQNTVSFREYIYLSHPLEIIFKVEKEDAKHYLMKYLHKINYFGKRGCFFQFVGYNDTPNDPNVKIYEVGLSTSGILQEYDDFGEKVTFEHVNNYSSKSTLRKKLIMVLPLEKEASSKSFSLYKKSNNDLQ